jgi:hypothetical protein
VVVATQLGFAPLNSEGSIRAAYQSCSGRAALAVFCINIWRSLSEEIMNRSEGICIERRPPFEDDVVRYYGQ